MIPGTVDRTDQNRSDNIIRVTLDNEYLFVTRVYGLSDKEYIRRANKAYHSITSNQ